MKVGIVRFPGTNCDRDIWFACESAKLEPVWLWHQDHFDVDSVESVIIPGGFSYGDYLRSGALAAKSTVMKSVSDFAKKGRPVLGICNGFQVLCEVGLLPGALVNNERGLFVDKWQSLKTVSQSRSIQCLDELQLPIAHGDGRYYIEDSRELFDDDKVWMTYQGNPNGSVEDIAGVRSANVHGLMPHPERALFDWMGGSAGMSFFSSLLEC